MITKRQETMLQPIRRIVTGHDTAGQATVLFDGVAGQTLEFPGRPGAGSTELWATDEAPADIDGTTDRARPMRHDPEPGGTLFRVVQIPPGSSGQQLDAGMHRSDTIDYLVVVSGQLTMLMGDGTEVALDQGDCVVQQGTLHAWVNRSEHPCLLAAVLVDARTPSA